MQGTIVQKNPETPLHLSHHHHRLFPDLLVSAGFRLFRCHREEPAAQFSVYEASKCSSSGINTPVGCLLLGPNSHDNNGFFGNCSPLLLATSVVSPRKAEGVKKGTNVSELFHSWLHIQAAGTGERRLQSGPSCRWLFCAIAPSLGWSL